MLPFPTPLRFMDRAASRTSPNPKIDFTRVRELSSDESLYATVVDSATASRVAAFIDPGSRSRRLGVFDLDLSGGASETIDLERAVDIHPEQAKKLSVLRRPVEDLR